MTIGTPVLGRNAIRLVAVVMSSALAVCLTAASALAAEYAVNTTQDPAPDGSCDAADCTLREALLIAGAAGGSDTIVVPAGTYVLSQNLGPLSLNGDTIAGAGARTTVINGNGVRVLSTSGTAAIAGVTITGGQDQQGPGGGGMLVQGTLQITNSHVIGNTANDGGGIYVDGGALLGISGSTVAGNRALDPLGPQGGGIAVEAEGRAVIANSTISGNVAQDSGGSAGQGGGASVGSGGVFALSSSTVAGNHAPTAGGLYMTGGATQLVNTIVDENTGGACAGAIATIAATSHHNLVQDGTCALQGAGNLQGASAQLLGLGNYGGPTDTRALAATSPARNTGSDCGTPDQRGIPRPQGGACDIGAFEYVAPTLTVTTTVTNNDGGEDGPADFDVHVRDAANADVAGSPQNGTTAGTTFTLAPGAFKVSAAGPSLYSVAIGGACSPAGDVVLGENQSATCTIVANDRAPRAGREVGVLPARGRVRVRRPGGKWQRLTGAGIMPNNTWVDTRKGRVTLIAAANRKGRETKADFYDGIFKFRQSKGRRPLTTLSLVEKLRCGKGSKARRADTASTAAKKKKRKKRRRLWGNGRGRFRTKGKHSAATVVGTKWLTQDRCKSTLTRVVRGRVKVRDLVKKKTVTVRRGKRYIARARG